jgi:hypothetical protein
LPSIHQLPWQEQRLYQFNQAKTACFATFVDGIRKWAEGRAL